MGKWMLRRRVRWYTRMLADAERAWISTAMGEDIGNVRWMDVMRARRRLEAAIRELEVREARP